jgi:hypothetical protein
LAEVFEIDNSQSISIDQNILRYEISLAGGGGDCMPFDLTTCLGNFPFEAIDRFLVDAQTPQACEAIANFLKKCLGIVSYWICLRGQMQFSQPMSG